ncbi:HTH_Tnp_Tc3_2 domain-containing protein [Trichonephila clavipes]|nr:HTH_Tnp_Tc3_2 domain-containing protein [Trichonephila clavipes]
MHRKNLSVQETLAIFEELSSDDDSAVSNNIDTNEDYVENGAQGVNTLASKNQYQSEDSVSRRPVPGRPRATTPAEDRFLALSARRRRTTTVPQLVADHFQASGRRIYATTVRNRLHNAGLYARRPVVCVPLNGRQRRNRLCWAREHVSWTQQQWTSVLFTDESRFTMESDSGRLLIWRE